MAELSIAQYVAQESVKNNIQQVLADKAPQFIASVSSLVNANEALKSAEKGSVLLACLTAASLDLPINQNLGFAYIIPYRDNKKNISVAQFQMGYKGFIQLAQRSGQVKTINVTDVKEGEISKENNLTGEMVFDWIEDKEVRASKKAIGYVAYIKLLNGFEKMLYMTKAELEKHGVKYSKSYKSGYGLWKDEFDTMAKKTVIKLLLSKYSPMTVDMQKAILADQAIVHEDGYEYTDNEKLTHDEVSDMKERERVLAHITAATTAEELEQCQDAVTPETQSAYDSKLKDLTKTIKA